MWPRTRQLSREREMENGYLLADDFNCWVASIKRYKGAAILPAGRKACMTCGWHEKVGNNIGACVRADCLTLLTFVSAGRTIFGRRREGVEEDGGTE